MANIDGPSERRPQTNDAAPVDEMVQTSANFGAPEEEDVITQPIARYFAFLAGGGLTTLGILGFIPFFSRGNVLFDIVRITPVASVIYLVSGVIGLGVAAINRRGAWRYYAMGIGFFYLIYFSLGNIDFGNIDDTVAIHSNLQRFQWIVFNAINAGLMLTGWLIAALSFMQKGDRSTREYRDRRQWSWESRTRLPHS